MQDQPQLSTPPAQPLVQHVHHYHTGPSAGAAIALELVPGFLIQTFGIGNLYAGNVAGGLLLMFGYWASLVVNVILCFLLIGFITLPLTWVAFMIFSPILANSAARGRAHQVAVRNS